jgi:hypothetical protein
MSTVDSSTSMFCAAHPDVETGLTCGRCGVPICPRCMVQTPVGARCRACARLRRPPMYEVSPLVAARAAGAAVLAGAALGVVWGVVLPPGFGFGFFGIFIALLIGSPLGYGFAELLDRVSNRKRGTLMQGIAIAGLVVAYVVHAVVGGGMRGDLFGIVLVVAACAGAVGRLR